MAFGRRKRDQDAAPGGEVEKETADAEADAPAAAGDWQDADLEGPFDIEDFDNPDDALMARLDLGSVLIPMAPGGQVQVELNQAGVPSAIWMVTANGRFTIAAYAAPKTPGQWNDVAGELADALREDNASVSVQKGPWGREVVGTGAGVVRFIGVDGYRWMLRCVVNGAAQTMDALVGEARQAVADTVVRRGDTPMPVRTPLPVELPEQMAAQLRAAAAQQAQQAMLAAQQAYQQQLRMQQEQQGQQEQQAQPQPQPQPGSAPGPLRNG